MFLCSVDPQGLLGQGVEAAHPQLPVPAPGGALGGGRRLELPKQPLAVSEAGGGF